MERETPKILTIAQLTRQIKQLLEAQIGAVWVAGEISNWSVAASGHAYFTLKDQTSQLDAVMFKGKRMRLRFTPENGLEVLVQGSVTVYERRGSYQIVVDEMQPKGLGALQLAYEALKKKLAAEGLFDDAHKKRLPLLPKRIGIVTSPTGAAIRDILQVIRRRFANVHILLYPARVQGEGAAIEIASGIAALDALGVDVMIVGRGGGSLEDLWAFNEEIVARAIFATRTPVISAVGHEIDYALSDFVADLRAPTPSAAAEIVVREQDALADQIRQKRGRLERAMRRIFEQAKARQDKLRASYVFTRAEESLRQERQLLDELRMGLERTARALLDTRKDNVARAHRALVLLSPQRRLEHQRDQLRALHKRLRLGGALLPGMFRSRFAPLPARLHSLSPLAVLGRGYALAFKMPEESLVHAATDVATGDELRLWVGVGEINAQVVSVNQEGGINQYELGKKR